MDLKFSRNKTNKKNHILETNHFRSISVSLSKILEIQPKKGPNIGLKIGLKWL